MKRFVIASFLTLCLVQAGAVRVLPQDRAPGFASLSVVVEPEKAEFILGEPLTLKVRLTNPTESEIAAPSDLDPAYGMLQVYVSRNGGEFKRYLGPGWGMKEPSSGAARISSDTPFDHDITLLFHNKIGGRDDLLEDSVPINEAGVYQIRVELYDSAFRQRIVAPVVDVQVFSPAGEAEQAIWQAVKANEDLAYFMQTGDVRRTQGVAEKAEQLVGKYPDNIQEKHLAFALGQYYLRQDKVERAIGRFKEAATSEAASSLRAQALLKLAESYVKKGEMKEALKISEAASSEYTERGMRQEFDALSSKIRQAGESQPIR
jgi:hypothetical protein